MPYNSYSQAEKQRICELISKGHSAKQVSEDLEIPIANIYRWKSLYDHGVSLEFHASPGRKRVLSSDEENFLAESLDQNPELSNEDLAALVDYKIAPRTISDYLHRRDPPFVRKLPSDEEPIDESKALVEGKKFLNTVRRYNNSIRIYQDESFVYDNERPRLGTC